MGRSWQEDRDQAAAAGAKIIVARGNDWRRTPTGQVQECERAGESRRAAVVVPGPQA